jgi:hypothetical protein
MASLAKKTGGCNSKIAPPIPFLAIDVSLIFTAESLRESHGSL